MTNEEAIKILKGAIKKPNTEDGYMGQALTMAIKALNQQTCEDAVSRQAVLGLFAQNGDAVRPYSKTWEEVKTLPPVDPQPKMGWIPVSERLPEIHQDVILSLSNLDVVVGFKAETEPYFYHYGYIDPQNVLAWMPLPEPYKIEEDLYDKENKIL